MMQGTKKLLFVAGAMAVGLAGLSADAGAQGRPNTITIYISTGGNAERPDAMSIVVDPYELVIKKNQSRVPVKIILESDNFIFPEGAMHGLDVRDNNGEFVVKSRGGQKKTLMITNFNRIAKTYKYSVTVVNEATGEEIVIDPKIKNGGGGVD